MVDVLRKSPWRLGVVGAARPLLVLQRALTLAAGRVHFVHTSSGDAPDDEVDARGASVLCIQ